MKINTDDTKFLNRDKDMTHKQLVEIVAEGIWEDSTRFKKEDGTPQKQFAIKFDIGDGEPRKTNLNYSNVKLLVEAFGDETKDWIGKKVRAWKTKSEKAKSGFIYVYVPEDWERDDTGEWIKSETDSVNIADMSEDDVIPDDADMPFPDLDENN